MSAKTLAVVFGIVFVIVGLLGFVGNPLVGSMGLFMTNHAHDLVHLLIGVILLIVAYTAPAKSASTSRDETFLSPNGFLLSSPEPVGASFHATDASLNFLLAKVIERCTKLAGNMN